MSKDNQAFNLIVEALAIDGTQYIVWDGRDKFLQEVSNGVRRLGAHVFPFHGDFQGQYTIRIRL